MTEDSDLTHAGEPVVDLKINSKSSLQEILSGFIPLLICNFGEGSTKQSIEYNAPRALRNGSAFQKKETISIFDVFFEKGITI